MVSGMIGNHAAASPGVRRVPRGDVMTDGHKAGDPHRPQMASDTEETSAVSSGGAAGHLRSDADRVWGSLEIVEELGRGAFGRVYRAWDPALAREVALKIIQLPHADRALGAAVLREGQMLARIRHRNVVAVFGAQQIDDQIGLWMELIRGRHLADLVRQEGPMGPEEATVIGISLCHALAAVHRAGLLHRDIKAHNVMRESGGRIVLMDFGAGRELTEATQSVTSEVTTGTPLYMAPEVLAGRPASPASDIYSLGVLLYFIVTGEYPIEGRTVTDIVVAHGLGRRRLLSDCRPDLPNEFVRVVERALSPSPGQRQQTAGAMMNDLADAMPGMSASWRNRLAEALEATHEDVSEGGGRSVGGPAPAPARRPGDSAWHSPVVRWAAVSAGVFIAIGLFGFLTSTAFDMQLGREGGFSDTSPWVWWVFGLRSLVGPLVYTATAVLIVRTTVALWRLARNAARPLARVEHRLTDALSRLARRLGLHDLQTAAQALVAVQVLGVALVWWMFRDFIHDGLVVIANTDPAEVFDWLAPGAATGLAYRPVLTVLLVAMISAWWVLLARASRGPAIDTGTRLGGLAVIVVVLLMLEFPYRLLHQNRFRRVNFVAERCYEIGARRGEVLLFCPDASPPRNRIVDATDDRLERTEIIESIFTPAVQEQ